MGPWLYVACVHMNSQSFGETSCKLSRCSPAVKVMLFLEGLKIIYGREKQKCFS